MRTLFRKAAMATAATLIALGLLNGLVFLGECVAYGTWWADGQPVGLYTSASGERPQLRPGARLRGLLYSISVNEMGFRGPELAEVKPDNGLRVWCVGGSTTFDIFAPDDAHTWPALLGVALQEALPDRAVEVINAGVPGEVLKGSALDVAAYAEAVQPDIVVVYHGPNDMRQVFAGPGSRPPPAAPPAGGGEVLAGPPGGDEVLAGPPDGGAGLGAMLNQDLALFRVLGRVLQSGQYLQLDLPDRRLHPGTMAPIKNEVEALLRQVTQAGAVPVMATHALRAAPDATGEVARRDVAETAVMLQMSPESAIRAFGYYNSMITEIARERGLALADVRSAVPADPEMWGDATHFRAPGSALAAAEIARAILDAGIVE